MVWMFAKRKNEQTFAYDIEWQQKVPSLQRGVDQDSRLSIWGQLGLLLNVAAASVWMESVCRICARRFVMLDNETCLNSLFWHWSISTSSTSSRSLHRTHGVHRSRASEHCCEQYTQALGIEVWQTMIGSIAFRVAFSLSQQLHYMANRCTSWASSSVCHKYIKSRSWYSRSPLCLSCKSDHSGLWTLPMSHLKERMKQYKQMEKWVRPHADLRAIDLIYLFIRFIYSSAEPRKKPTNSFALAWWLFVLCRLIRTFALFELAFVRHSEWGAQQELNRFRQRIPQNRHARDMFPLSATPYETRPVNVARYLNRPILRLLLCLSMHVCPHQHCTSAFSPSIHL